MFHKLTSTKILLLIILLIPSVVLARVKPTEDFYVNDYASVISENTKKHIMDQNILLHDKTGAQIVVVTVPSLDGEDVESYANGLFRDFGIGDKTKNNGLLLLISTGDRKVRIEVGYGLEEILPDGKTGRIIDNYMITSLKNNDYDTASLKGFDALFNEVVKFYNLENLEVEVEEDNSAEDIIGIIFYVIMIIIIFIILTRGGRGRGLGNFIYLSDFGGSSHSSGGSSFGGFSGGGGSSGGGGASRGF